MKIINNDSYHILSCCYGPGLMLGIRVGYATAKGIISYSNIRYTDVTIDMREEVITILDLNKKEPTRVL